MIRYPITGEELFERIRIHRANWFNRTRRRTNRFRQNGGYRETGRPIWSEIKRVYIMLQHGKCAYCERLIGEDAVSSVEWHLDHFRPKSRVCYWPPPVMARDLSLSYGHTTGDAAPTLGYFLLAYHPQNFAAACGTCNTSLKSDFFPICGPQRVLDGEDPSQMNHEEPLLIYPIGNLDDDPEALISFIGFIPIPSVSDESRRRRAQVTIDFFRLGPEQGRADLVSARALIIRLLYFHLSELASPELFPNRRADIQGEIERLVSPGSPHTNCARSFRRLYETDPTLGRAVYESCCDYLSSHHLQLRGPPPYFVNV